MKIITTGDKTNGNSSERCGIVDKEILSFCGYYFSCKNWCHYDQNHRSEYCFLFVLLHVVVCSTISSRDRQVAKSPKKTQASDHNIANKSQNLTETP